MSYAAVQTRPEGTGTPARMALTAAERGYDGVVVRNHGDATTEYDAEAILEAYDVDVVRGVEVRAEDPSRAHGLVGNHRERAAVVAVHGGTDEMNRFAATQHPVDVLAHPTAGDGTVDHGLVKTAAEHDVHLEIDLGPVLRDSGGGRVRHIQALETLWTLIDDVNARYVVSATPTSHHHVSSPRDLAAVGDVVGLDAADVRAGLEAWGSIAERNRERFAPEFVEPGVRRLGETDES